MTPEANDNQPSPQPIDQPTPLSGDPVAAVSTPLVSSISSPPAAVYQPLASELDTPAPPLTTESTPPQPSAYQSPLAVDASQLAPTFVPKNLPTSPQAATAQLSPATGFGGSQRQHGRKQRLAMLLVAFLAIIISVGAWFGYRTYIFEEKHEVLLAFEKVYVRSGLVSGSFSGPVRQLQDIEPSLAGGGAFLPSEDKFKDSFEEYDESAKKPYRESIDELKQAFDSYNKHRDKEFVANARDYLAQAQACYQAIDRLDADVQSFYGQATEINNLVTQLKKSLPFDDAAANKLAAERATKIRQLTASLKAAKSESSLFQAHRTGLIVLFEANALLYQKYDSKTAKANFDYLTFSTKLAGVDNQFHAALLKGLAKAGCNQTSKSAEYLGRIFKETDFKKEEESLIESIKL